MTVTIPRWLICSAFIAAGALALYGGIIPLIRIAIWCGLHGCS